jgi:hypothetical protein
VIPALLSAVTSLAALAGPAKILLGLVQTGITAAGKTAQERAQKKADADAAFKALRVEIEDNLAVVRGVKTERLAGLPVNDRAVKALVRRLSSEAAERVYLCSQPAGKTAEIETFTRALFYTRRKIEDLKRLSSSSGAELALVKPPRLAVRLKNLEAYLEALRKLYPNPPRGNRGTITTNPANKSA